MWPFNWNLFVSILTWCYLFSAFCKIKLGIFLNFLLLPLLGVKGFTDLAAFLLLTDWEGVLKLLLNWPEVQCIPHWHRNQEPSVSQNLPARVVVLAKTLQHYKTAISKYSNYFWEIREKWLRYDWGGTERASVLLHAQRVWSHPNIKDLIIRGWWRQQKGSLHCDCSNSLFCQM